MNHPQHGQPAAAPRPVAPPVHHPHHPPQHHHQTGIPAMPVQPLIPQDLEPLSLEEDEPQGEAPRVGNKIQAFGVSMGGGPSSHAWKRKPHVTGQGICRVKSFHGRLSDQGMDYLDSTINEWLDAHPDVDVKAVTTNTNMFDGKMKELALIVNIWY